jgi:hypothetical protein
MIPLPPCIDPDAWAAFVEMRKAKGKRAPFTLAAAKRIVYELDRLKSQGHPPAEVLWQSTMNGWSGVFPLRKLTPDSPGSPQSFRERDQQAAADRMAQLAPGVADRRAKPAEVIDVAPRRLG